MIVDGLMLAFSGRRREHLTRGLWSRQTALWSVVALVLAAAIALVVVPHAAHADTSPPSGTLPTVSNDALPTVQIDGVVWAQVTVGNTVYVTGKFQHARPAGTPAG